MYQISSVSDQKRLRRSVLHAQGLHQRQAFGVGQDGALKAIQHLGYLQIDTISVIERAHHHVLYSRVPKYTPDMLHTLLKKRQVFEYWAHAAAFLPIEDFRFSLPYKQAIRNGKTHWYKDKDKKRMKNLLERIRQHGPLRARELESEGKGTSLWWDWKPDKRALEQLYMEGEIMVREREGVQKVYDLTERVLPAGIDTRLPDTNAFAEYLLEAQIRHHGVFTVKSVTYLRRDPALRRAVQALVNERVSQRQLQRIKLPSGEVCLIEPWRLEQPLPATDKRVRFLSPFDNAVIQRERLRHVFEYDFQLECYLPPHKRQYGYFSLPILYRDQFVGRVDCKAHRGDRVLALKSLHLHEFPFTADAFVAEFAAELRRFSSFQRCEGVAFNCDGAASRALLRALKSSQEAINLCYLQA